MTTEITAPEKIDGIYYCFNDEGILQMGWKKCKRKFDSIKDYMYFGPDGKAKIGCIHRTAGRAERL